MYIALDENKIRVHIGNADKSKQYFCPVCGEELIIKAVDSLSVKPHFAHKKGTECLDTWQHDMSEWHYNWQCMFPEEFREVVVEKDGIKHRADVLINGCVIEFQHSPITAVEIVERNTFYLNCGYKVIWVFDAQNKVKNIYGAECSIDPFQGELEWKRARREFDIPTPSGVFVLIEYETKLSTNPPQEVRILLHLKKFNPKKIESFNTCPYYITRGNLLKTLGFKLEGILSIDDILKEHEKFERRRRIESNQRREYYIVPQKHRRKFRF